MRVFNRDDDLAVLLPEVLVEKLRLKEGDELEVVAAGKDEITVAKIDKSADEQM